MAAADYEGLIEACMRLGDASRGGDPQLWSEVLEYFGSQQSDVTQQVGPSPGQGVLQVLKWPAGTSCAASRVVSSQQSACTTCWLPAPQARLGEGRLCLLLISCREDETVTWPLTAA